jgi:hypothetical protein
VCILRNCAPLGLSEETLARGQLLKKPFPYTCSRPWITLSMFRATVYEISRLGPPPALPEDAQSCTVLGDCRSSSSRWWALTVRLRLGPSKGPALVQPLAVSEDPSWQDTRVRPWWHTRGAMPAQRARKVEAARTEGMAIESPSRVCGLTLCSRGTGIGGSPTRGPRGRPPLRLAMPLRIVHPSQTGPTEC